MDVSPMDSPLVGQTPSQILGFHLCRSAKSAEATVCGMGISIHRFCRWTQIGRWSGRLGVCPWSVSRGWIYEE